MKSLTLSLAALFAMTALQADNDGVIRKLKHGDDAKVIVGSKQSVDDLSSMFSEGKTSGQIRIFYVDRAYNGYATSHRNGMTAGGHLKFETAAFKGLSLATAFYTVQDVPVFDYTSNGGVDGKKSPALLGTGYDSYSIIGEAYVNYSLAEYGTKTAAKLGYQRYDTAMMGSDDARTLPNTFEVYKLTNSDVKNLSLQLAQVTSMAYGSFSNIYSGGVLASTSGYPVKGNAGTGKYINLGAATTGKNTAGITNIQAKYKAKNFHISFSDDYAWDMYNTLYIDGGVSYKGFFIQGQAIKQNSVGSENMQGTALSTDGKIDSLYLGGKAGVKMAGAIAYVAYSQTPANSASDATAGNYNNSIVSQFGGMPAYTQGMVTRHQFLAGTKAYKLAAAYNFKDLGVNFSAAAYYASFDVDANSGYGGARTATEPGFDLKYYPASVKKLQLRFRGNFPRDFADNGTQTAGWDEYRLIANYNF